MVVVLIGYMGSGKSAIGKFLAKKEGLHYTDLDHYIEEKEGKTISEIFETKGEVYFRKKEHGYLKKLVQSSNNTIISLGGGTPCYGDNMSFILSATNNVFYLKASIETLLNRLKKEKLHRPLIKDIDDADLPEFIQKHLFERNFYYLQAKHIVTVDAKSIEGIANEIAARLT